MRLHAAAALVTVDATTTPIIQANGSKILTYLLTFIYQGMLSP